MNAIPTDLSLQPAAWEILKLLPYQDIHDDVDTVDPDRSAMDFETFAWYNGRENCVCLTARRKADKGNWCLIVVFGEARGSDCVFVDCWIDKERPRSSNPPHWKDKAYDRAYKLRRTFDEGDQSEDGAEYIAQLIKDYFEEDLVSLSWVCPKCKQEGDMKEWETVGGACPRCYVQVQATSWVLVPASADPSVWTKEEEEEDNAI
jgi:hypothetical protein